MSLARGGRICIVHAVGYPVYMRFLPLLLISVFSCYHSGDKKTEPPQIDDSVTYVSVKKPVQAGIENKSSAVKSTPEKLKPPCLKEAKKLYSWRRTVSTYEPLSIHYPVPKGFKRVSLKHGSWSWWLRHLPMRPKGTIPKDFKGRVIKDHGSYVSGVVDLDIGKKDLQQCIDTIIRLRAEYLWVNRKRRAIGFRYSGRRKFFWYQWSGGFRPKRIKGRLKFIKSRAGGGSKRYFYSYLNYMYMMTGTIHHTGKPTVNLKNITPGNYFVTIHPEPIMGGAGHAVIILDLAVNKKSEFVALIAQGDIPAQDFHIIKNQNGDLWFKLPPKNFQKSFLWPTPFYWKDLKGFKN